MVPLTIGIAVGTGFSMSKFGNRTVGSWAMPIAGAILFGGIGYTFNIPDWLIVGGFLATPLVFHKNVKDQLKSSAKSLGRLKLSEERGELIAPPFQPDAPATRLGYWELAPDRSSVLTLDFKGAEDEEYQVILAGQAGKGHSGVLSVQAPDSSLELDPVDVQVVVSGPQLRIVSNEIFSKNELRRLLVSAGLLLKKITDVGREESPAGA
jgi:hypothetical protein